MLQTTLALLLTATVLANAAQQPATATSDGHAAFVTYCASCHGTSGRGDGPVADDFRHRPADLTQVAKRNGGVFNASKVHAIVDGRAVKAHGTTEMPVWGDAFKWKQGLPEEAIRARIEALVRYLESIQERAGH